MHSDESGIRTPEPVSRVADTVSEVHDVVDMDIVSARPVTPEHVDDKNDKGYMICMHIMLHTFFNSFLCSRG